jgi:hypothetical protein
MTILLTNQLKKDLILIDPYYSQKQEKIALEISVNKMMELRKQAGLNPKEKGRPKGTGMTFKGEDNILPEEIIKAKDRAKIEIKIQKLLTVYPDIEVDGKRLRETKYKLIYDKLKNKTVEEQLQIIKDFKHEQSRIEEFINK